jgi:hypothetical protein
LEIRGRRATPAGRVEKDVKVKKAERDEKARMPHAQQGSTAIQTRILGNRFASGTKVLWLKPRSENKCCNSPPPIQWRWIVALGKRGSGISGW